MEQQIQAETGTGGEKQTELETRDHPGLHEQRDQSAVRRNHCQKIGWSLDLLEQLLRQQLIILTLAGSPEIKCSI